MFILRRSFSTTTIRLAKHFEPTTKLAKAIARTSYNKKSPRSEIDFGGTKGGTDVMTTATVNRETFLLDHSMLWATFHRKPSLLVDGLTVHE
ncbi:hypothetical protein HK098_006329 [Nowakowskiella sp. JEL0407]|nr:hypothetical protein HK098_006329 [Nowakowskiella sp. JEL0407]